MKDYWTGRDGQAHEIFELEDPRISPDSVAISSKVERIELSSDFLDALRVFNEMVNEKGQITEEGLVSDENRLRRFVNGDILVAHLIKYAG